MKSSRIPFDITIAKIASCPVKENASNIINKRNMKEKRRERFPFVLRY